MKIIKKIKSSRKRKRINEYYKKPSLKNIFGVRGLIVLIILVGIYFTIFLMCYQQFKDAVGECSNAYMRIYAEKFEEAYERYIEKTDSEHLEEISSLIGRELSDDELYDQFINQIRGGLLSLYGDDLSVNMYDENLEKGVMDFEKPYLSLSKRLKVVYNNQVNHSTYLYYSYKNDFLADEIIRFKQLDSSIDMVVEGYYVKGLEFIPKDLYFEIGNDYLSRSKNPELHKAFIDGEIYWGESSVTKRIKIDLGVGNEEEMKGKGYKYIDETEKGHFDFTDEGVNVIFPNTQQQKDTLEAIKEEYINNCAQSSNVDLDYYDYYFDKDLSKLDCRYTYGLRIEKDEDKVSAYNILFRNSVSFWDDKYYSYSEFRNYFFRYGEFSNKEIFTFIFVLMVILWILITFIISFPVYLRKKNIYEMNIYQRDLTNIMAHDLKSPLMVIRGSAENLQDEDKYENEYAKTIIEESDYMSSLISRILSLSKLESNQTEMKREEVDIKSIFDEIIEKYSEETEKREIKTTIESGDRIRTIKADSFWIKEALMNLYDNAVKYSEDGSEIKIILGEKEILISNKMADSEIKEKDIEKLKKSFVRGDNARSGQAGNGLGLSIAESILMRNNLSLSLRKEKDNFIVSIR